MRVLHAGILHSPNLAIGRAMIERGHEVKEYDCRGTKDINGTLVSVAREWNPDLVFMQIQSPDIITAATCDAMRATGAFVIHWSGDVRAPMPEFYKQLAPHVDITSFTNETDNDIIRALGHDARYLQIGYEDLIYNLVRTEGRSGIVFMGNSYYSTVKQEDGSTKKVWRFPQSEARDVMVDRMKAEFGDAFTVYGNGWGKGARHLSPHQEAEAYNSALIAVGMDHFLRPYFASDRLLRSQACGACVFQQRYPGMHDEHHALLGWDTLDELVSKCRDVLPYPDLCMAHGRAQSKYTLENHRWHNRVEQMEQWMNEHKNRKA